MNHNVPLNDSRTAVLSTLTQLRRTGANAWNHGTEALSETGTWVLLLLSLIFLTAGALTLKVNQFAHEQSFGVRKERAA